MRQGVSAPSGFFLGQGAIRAALERYGNNLFEAARRSHDASRIGFVVAAAAGAGSRSVEGSRGD